MDQKESARESPTTDEALDDHEKVVNDLIEEVTGINVDEINQNNKNDSNSSEENESEKDKFEDCEAHDYIDDELQKKQEEGLTEEELDKAKLRAEELKNEGNDLFMQAEYEKSIDKYTEALRSCPVVCAPMRAIIYGNRKLRFDYFCVCSSFTFLIVSLVRGCIKTETGLETIGNRRLYQIT